MKYSKDAFGSTLEITLYEQQSDDSAMTESFFVVEQFEKNYSRFLEDNLLSKINDGKASKISPELKYLIDICHKVSVLTKGHFDITLLPVLENAGYGISSHKQKVSTGYENIQLEDDTLTLHQGVQIEFGSCGKGYMLDVIYNILSKKHKNFVINFGGDMRIAGSKTILLEDPHDRAHNIGSIELENISIASSAGNRRRFGGGHHLISGLDNHAQNDKIAVYVTHKLGIFADIFATALFVSPTKLSLEILEKMEGLEALIIDKNGKLYKTRGFTAKLNI